MSAYVKTLKTADTNGYVLPLPVGGCSRLVLGSESGDHWIEPVTGQTSDPATPTNALITSTAGVRLKSSALLCSAAPQELAAWIVGNYVLKSSALHSSAAPAVTVGYEDGPADIEILSAA